MTGTSRARSTRVAVAALAGVAMISLSACNADRIGQAAVVSDLQIPISDLQDRVTDFDDYATELELTPPTDQTTAQRYFLQAMVTHELYQDIAEAQNIKVTPAQVDSLLSNFEANTDDVGAALVERGLTPATVQDAVFDSIVAQAILDSSGEEAVITALEEASAAAGVWVNPRYGQWTGSVIDGVSGSLSVPFEVPEEPAAP